MKKAKEIAKKHCLEFARKIYPNVEEHYDTPEWMIEAMKEYACEAIKEQRAKDVKSMLDGNCADIRFITETDLIELK